MPRFWQRAGLLRPKNRGDEKPQTAAIRQFTVYYTEFAPVRVPALPDAQA
jgi:hypothetical protein